MNFAMIHKILLSLLALFMYPSSMHAISVTTKAVNPREYEITISIPVKGGDFIYTDYLKYSIDCPSIVITSESLSVQPSERYFPEFNDNKKIISENFKIYLSVATQSDEQKNCNLFLEYYPKSNRTPKKETFPLSFIPYEKTIHLDIQKVDFSDTQNQNKKISFYMRLQDALNSTKSLWIQLILAFLLGLLVSLTPCIYPMIPITVGILQSQSSKSILKNFLLSLSYTVGLSTTFALLGLFAAFTGQLFGTVFANPWFISIIVLFIIYISGSMIGFYELYVPSFVQSPTTFNKGGSFISAFLFGALSGTIASPCLSPGLLLLLTIVTTTGSKILGFFLLFIFGIGLSLPLLIIGTFSSSLAVLPRAGNWMVEVKQISGFFMLGTCFYFLKPLLPHYLLYALSALYLLAVGFYYLLNAYNSQGFIRILKIILGIILIISSIVTGTYYIQELSNNSIEQNLKWHTDYQAAIELAKKEQKPLLLEVTGDFCSICSAIERKIFIIPIMEKLCTLCVPVKIKNLDSANSVHESLTKKFGILGVPACILIEPSGEIVCKKWGAELYDLTPEQFLEEIDQYKKTVLENQ